ncbi:MAG: sulfotransferase [Thiohalocapsa sp.]|nr:sulfotransferase [Thiohalocapsa sp.]MCF7992110.1 sulfotransferase [Thiohalocapsa sp.]
MIDHAQSPVPIVVGGTGGSGTRVLRKVLCELGVFMGSRVNGPGDAIDFSDVLNRHLGPLLAYTRTLDYRLDDLPDELRGAILRDLGDTLSRYRAEVPKGCERWGWDNPRIIYLLPFVAHLLPQVGFVHLVRDGRDVALSENRNQIRLHFGAISGHQPQNDEGRHADSVTMWSTVSTTAATAGFTLLGTRYLALRFEDLCEQPREILEQLCGTLELRPSDSAVDAACRALDVPESIGRWRRQPLHRMLEIQNRSDDALSLFGYAGVRSPPSARGMLAMPLKPGPTLVLGPSNEANHRMARVLDRRTARGAPLPAANAGFEAEPAVRSDIAGDTVPHCDPDDALESVLGDTPRLALHELLTEPRVQACCANVLMASPGAVLAPGSRTALHFWLRWCERQGLAPDFVLLLGAPQVSRPPPLASVEDSLALELLSRGCRRLVICPTADDPEQAADELAAWVRGTQHPAAFDPRRASAAEALLSELSGMAAPDDACNRLLAGVADAIRRYDAGAKSALAAIGGLYALSTMSPPPSRPEASDSTPAEPNAAATTLAEARAGVTEMARLFERLYLTVETMRSTLTWRAADMAASVAGRLLRLPESGIDRQIGQLHRRFLEFKARHPQMISTGELAPASLQSPGADDRLRVGALLCYNADGTPVASAFIRLILPLTHSSVQDRIRFRAVSLEDVEAGWPQVLIVQRTFAPDSAAARRIIDLCSARGIRMVLEIDDDLFTLQSNWRRPTNYTAGCIGALREIARTADLVVTSTRPLQQVLERYNDRVHVLPNALDEHLWLTDEPRTHDNAFNESDDVPIRILYQGTRTHDADLDIIADALTRLRKQFGTRVEIELIGGLGRNRSGLERAFTRVLDDVPEIYPEHVEWLRSHRRRWQIGIIPLAASTFNASKSHIKFLDYTALGLAIACSDVESYRPIARDGINALVVDHTRDAWYRALHRLVEDPRLRRQLRDTAFHHLSTSHLLKQHAPDYAGLLESLAGVSPRKAT